MRGRDAMPSLPSDDFEALVPFCPVNTEITLVDREYAAATAHTCEPDQRSVREVDVPIGILQHDRLDLAICILRQLRDGQTPAQDRLQKICLSARTEKERGL